jgi:hypothetical protein
MNHLINRSIMTIPLTLSVPFTNKFVPVPGRLRTSIVHLAPLSDVGVELNSDGQVQYEEMTLGQTCCGCVMNKTQPQGKECCW